MKQRHVTVLASLAAVVVLIYGLLGVVIWFRWHNNSSSPTVQIVSPLPGSRLTEGDSTTLKAAVTGKDILRLELAVDGVTIAAAPNPDPTQRVTWVVTHDWAAESEGSHQIEALAYRTGNGVAALDSVAVEVVPPGEIAFASKRTGNYQVFTLRTDGTAVAQDHRWQPGLQRTGLEPARSACFCGRPSGGPQHHLANGFRWQHPSAHLLVGSQPQSYLGPAG